MNEFSSSRKMLGSIFPVARLLSVETSFMRLVVIAAGGAVIWVVIAFFGKEIVVSVRGRDGKSSLFSRLCGFGSPSGGPGAELWVLNQGLNFGSGAAVKIGAWVGIS